MANLAEAVDAAETDWIISADIPHDTEYLTVESEVVEVLAHFPGQPDPQTLAAVPPRIRVRRGAGGTTAASHADTTALTPLIPPSAAEGGAGGLTVTDGVTEVEASTLSLLPGTVSEPVAGTAAYSDIPVAWVVLDATGLAVQDGATTVNLLDMQSGGTQLLSNDPDGLLSAKLELYGGDSAKLSVLGTQRRLYMDADLLELVHGAGKLTVDDDGVHLGSAATNAVVTANPVADLADPATASAEDCANKINELLSELRISGLLET